MRDLLIVLLILLPASLYAARPAAAVDSSPAASATPATKQPAQLAPGTSITASNVAEFAQYLPAALQSAIRHGFVARVVPTTRIDWSSGFKNATEKYYTQVGLDKDGYITNYTAGMPFPTVSSTDPDAAIKIAYNWHMGPFMPDDFSLAPWGSFAYLDNKQPNAFTPEEDYDFICDQFSFLRFAHRTELDPRPTLSSNAQGFEWKARCNAWTQSLGSNAGEGAGIWLRYVGPKQIDEFYGYDPMSRRIQRSGTFGLQPDQNCRACHQPYWAYALPKTESFTYRLLGTAPLLGCLAASAEPAGMTEGDNGMKLDEAPFEIRTAYILEMTPVEASQRSMRTLVYIDTEAYVWLAAEFYDVGEQTATAFPLWRSHPAAEGGSNFALAGEFYVPAAQPSPGNVPVLFFRSLMPAHGGFDQKINSGSISEALFNPASLAR
jgi:Protein of unknown function (DUF1329)